MTITIDFARAEDIDALSVLLSELFTLESDFIPDHTKQVRGLALIIDRPWMGQIFVVRDAGIPIGMANALRTVSTAEGREVILLEDVILNKHYRGQGLGKRLLTHIEAWAREQQISRITLLADQDNQPAIDFYQTNGFTLSAMKALRKALPATKL